MEIKMKEQVFEFLEQEKIPYDVTEHEPVYTMEDMERVGLDKLGTLCKNLFIRDAKGKSYFLITASNDTAINLKELGEKLGAGKVSFASAERLQQYLGVTAGCVSPFGVLNDAEHKVEVIFDQKLQGEKRLGVHPNEHDATVWISFSDLQKALKKTGSSVKILKL
ncbi:YbaK/EbsC family protein [Oscillibacter sp.]|uniref:prolyl-tRNA synthetase associated domain-containing protein n=1 Tax=Oscillibacter sp. TaxID=1945593 RepID=UPI003397A508